MKWLRQSILRIIFVCVVFCLLSHPVLGAAAKLSKSVTPLEDGNYLIRLKVTATASSIYALKLSDPAASIVDVYAPRGWCMVTDGGDLVARTGNEPVSPGKAIELMIHTNAEEIHFTWAVFGKIEQLGKPETF